MNKIIMATGKETNIPYQLQLSGMKVFSLEEFLYHSCRNYEVVIDDFPQEDLCQWIFEVLELKEEGNYLRNSLNQESSSYKRFLSFLSRHSYVDKHTLILMEQEISAWIGLDEVTKLKRKGKLCLKYYRYHEARSFLERASEMVARDGDILHNLGVAYGGLMQFQIAAAYFMQAYEINNNPSSLIQYAYAKEILLSPVEFRSKINSYAEKMNLAELWYLMGQAYQKEGNFEEAFVAYNKVFRESLLFEPDSLLMNTYERIIEMFCLQNKWDWLDYISKLKTECGDVYILLCAFGYTNMGQMDSAIQYLESHICDTQSWSREKNIRLSKLYNMQGDPLKSIDTLMLAGISSLNQDDTTIYNKAYQDKLQGKVGVYYQVLEDMLKKWKSEHRTQIIKEVF